jgi:hypothetical protein
VSTWTKRCRGLLAALMLVCAGAVSAPPPMYEIHNASDRVVSFYTMDPARGTWKLQQLRPSERRELAWHSGATAGRLRIGTEGRGHVQYDVYAGQRYAIVWNARKGVWDLSGRGHLARQGPPDAAPAAHSDGMRRPAGCGGGQPRQASWILHNRSNERIEFETLDPARGTWRSQVSYPHQSTPYTMSPGAGSGKIRIATTDRGYVEYDVHAGGAYSILWNRHTAMWELRNGRQGG